MIHLKYFLLTKVNVVRFVDKVRIKDVPEKIYKKLNSVYN